MAPTRLADDSDVLVTALVKGSERYIFMYEDTDIHKCEVLRRMGKFASNPELSLTWYDVAILSQKVRAGNKEGMP